MWFTLSLLLLLGFSTYLVMAPGGYFEEAFEIKSEISTEFRLCIIVIAFINGIITYFYEKIGIWYFSLWYKSRKDRIQEL